MAIFAPRFKKDAIIFRKIMLNRGVAQLASVLAWGARGRVFESHHPDLIIKQI